MLRGRRMPASSTRTGVPFALFRRLPVLPAPAGQAGRPGRGAPLRGSRRYRREAGRVLFAVEHVSKGRIVIEAASATVEQGWWMFRTSEGTTLAVLPAAEVQATSRSTACSRDATADSPQIGRGVRTSCPAHHAGWFFPVPRSPGSGFRAVAGRLQPLVVERIDGDSLVGSRWYDRVCPARVASPSGPRRVVDPGVEPASLTARRRLRPARPRLAAVVDAHRLLSVVPRLYFSFSAGAAALTAP